LKEENSEMTNDELLAILREDLIGFKTEIREDLIGFKTEIRGEINTAIQASEARMIERMDGIGKRVDAVQESVREVKGDLVLLDNKVDQCVSLLGETVNKVAEQSQDLFNLENKMDNYHSVVRKDIQALAEQIAKTDKRLTNHINTPLNKAHPEAEPGSAA
jgi:chromosome segregation ATPase